MKQKPLSILLRLSERDKQNIVDLATEWQTTHAEAIRRAVLEALAKRKRR
jgi:hypothetical protein